MISKQSKNWTLLHLQMVITRKGKKQLKQKLEEMQYNSVSEFLREKIRGVLNDE